MAKKIKTTKLLVFKSIKLWSLLWGMAFAIYFIFFAGDRWFVHVPKALLVAYFIFWGAIIGILGGFFYGLLHSFRNRSGDLYKMLATGIINCLLVSFLELFPFYFFLEDGDLKIGIIVSSVCICLNIICGIIFNLREVRRESQNH